MPTQIPTFKAIVLPPGSYTIHLLIDSREVRTKRDRDHIVKELLDSGIAAEQRVLPLGDALWIARLKPAYMNRLRQGNADDTGQFSAEIMLDHIVERKRLDDLISSIKDGRFREQKFRLRRSGIGKCHVGCGRLQY